MNYTCTSLADIVHMCVHASVQVYAPSRTVVVYAPSGTTDKDADRSASGIPGLSVRGTGPNFAM